MRNSSASRLVFLAGLTAVLFFLGALVTEMVPEIPVDMDLKPFFIPLFLVAVLPAGAPAWAVGIGAAIGEGLEDVLEGYEVDDPLGFIGYVLGFVIAGYIIGDRPRNVLLVVVACVVAAFVQSTFEGVAFLIFGGESLSVVARSILGNTVINGSIVLGMFPTLVLILLLHGRVERFLGFAPLGDTQEWE